MLKKPIPLASPQHWIARASNCEKEVRVSAGRKSRRSISAWNGRTLEESTENPQTYPTATTAPGTSMLPLGEPRGGSGGGDVAPLATRGPTLPSRLARGLTRGGARTSFSASTVAFAKGALPPKKVSWERAWLGVPSDDPLEKWEWTRWTGFLKTRMDLDRSKCASRCSSDRLRQYRNTAAQQARHDTATPAPHSTKIRGFTPSSSSLSVAATATTVVRNVRMTVVVVTVVIVVGISLTEVVLAVVSVSVAVVAVVVATVSVVVCGVVEDSETDDKVDEIAVVELAVIVKYEVVVV